MTAREFGRGGLRLGVNIDHVATLRQQRAGLVDYPNLVEAALLCREGGADQLTIHVRGDRRHIQEADLKTLMSENILPINLEMAATDEMISMAEKYRPFIVCLVPEKREELTTEGGLDVVKNQGMVKKAILRMKDMGVRVSLFIEPSKEQIEKSQSLGAEAVEFHTGKYALSAGAAVDHEATKLQQAFITAHEMGLAVHAGHGLDYRNTQKIAGMPFLQELNIGHSIVCRAVLVGLKQAVFEMKKIVESP